MSINTAAIESVILSVVNSESFKLANRSAIASVTRPIAEEAANKLEDCINSSVSSSGLSGMAVAAVGQASVASISDMGDGIHYDASIDLPANSRPSLVPEKYGGINDMAVLFNAGYDAGGTVTGEWHGIIVTSLPHRPALHFVQSGVDDFNGNYGSAYNAHAEVSGRF